MNDADSRRAVEELQRLGYLPTHIAEEAVGVAEMKRKGL